MFVNIVVPMAGAGSRFAKVGYTDPKPLIKIHSVPMIEMVINNLRPSCPHRFIFICQKAHVAAYGLAEKLGVWAPGCELIQLDGMTEGAACTVLTAKSLINDGNPLMIANSDQYVDIAIDDYLRDMDQRHLDGLIMTLKSDDPKWSYASIDAGGFVTNVVEKEVISPHATVGIYNYKRGGDFVAAAEAMIAADMRVKGEFYVAPVYNIMIKAGKKIGIYGIGGENDGMYGVGIPSDLETFLILPISHKATAITKGNAT
jgi:dTDP-glucose pyrophosphorylase